MPKRMVTIQVPLKTIKRRAKGEGEGEGEGGRIVAGRSLAGAVRKPTAYNRFIKANMPSVLSFAPKKRFVELGARWRSLSAAEKAAY